MEEGASPPRWALDKKLGEDASMEEKNERDKVAGLALAQSPYGGTPIASDLLREGQLGDYVNLRKLTEILICKVIKVC